MTPLYVVEELGEWPESQEGLKRQARKDGPVIKLFGALPESQEGLKQLHVGLFQLFARYRYPESQEGLKPT